MATKKAIDTTITAVVPEKAVEVPAAKVAIFIPKDNGSEDGSVVDQNEYVTINGKTTKIPRGEHVEVTIPVFQQLRNRYPEL